MANVDILPQFSFGENNNHGIGLALGLGLGYLDYKNNYIDKAPSKFGINVNVGLFYVYKQHFIELGAKWMNINFATGGAGSRSGNGAYSWSGLSVIGSVGYAYVF